MARKTAKQRTAARRTGAARGGKAGRPATAGKSDRAAGAARKTASKTAGRPAKKPAKVPLVPAVASKPWTPAEVEEAFRRFQAANPEPKGELVHINPYTLLVAVVLSAQATDAGVNKATPALFKLADTPEKMVALGEDKVRDLIKTIGLYRT
jgi:endonuclease-3